MITKEWQANLMLFTTALIWGIAFIAQRLVVGLLGTYSFNALRFFIGMLSMLPILFVLSKKSRSRQSASDRQPNFDRQPGFDPDSVPLRRTLLPGMALGVVLFVASVFQQTGLQWTTAGKAGFITDLYIVLVPLAGLLFGRRPGAGLWASVALAAAGLYLLSVTGGFRISRGDLCELAGSVFWTVHILLIDRFSKRWNAVRLSFLQYAVSMALSLLVALPTETVSIPNLLRALPASLYCGIFSVGIAFTLQIAGQRHSKPAHASIILSMESVFACLAGILFLHERLSLRSGIGCALMVAAMLLTQMDALRRRKAEPTPQAEPAPRASRAPDSTLP